MIVLRNFKVSIHATKSSICLRSRHKECWISYRIRTHPYVPLLNELNCCTNSGCHAQMHAYDHHEVASVKE